MPVSLYEASVPPFTQMLQCQLGILHKLQAHAASRGIDPNGLIRARLSQDAPTIAGQIDQLSGIALRAMVLLTGARPPALNPRLDSFEALKTRLVQVLAFLKQLKADQFAGVESRLYDIPFGRSKTKLTGSQYLFHVAMPSFYFHASMVVGILRAAGVEVSRVDYLQPPD